MDRVLMARDLREVAEREEALAAEEAHREGASLEELAELLGVSRQTAWRRVRVGRELRTAAES